MDILIMVPAHQNIYSNLDKAVGHYGDTKRIFQKDLFV